MCRQRLRIRQKKNQQAINKRQISAAPKQHRIRRRNSKKLLLSICFFFLFKHTYIHAAFCRCCNLRERLRSRLHINASRHTNTRCAYDLSVVHTDTVTKVTNDTKFGRYVHTNSFLILRIVSRIANTKFVWNFAQLLRVRIGFCFVFGLTDRKKSTPFLLLRQINK